MDGPLFEVNVLVSIHQQLFGRLCDLPLLWSIATEISMNYWCGHSVSTDEKIIADGSFSWQWICQLFKVSILVSDAMSHFKNTEYPTWVRLYICMTLCVTLNLKVFLLHIHQVHNDLPQTNKQLEEHCRCCKQLGGFKRNNVLLWKWWKFNSTLF